MGQDHSINLSAGLPSGSDRRSSGRMLQHGVVSNLGIVVDISAGGMKLLCTRGQAGHMSVSIEADSESLELQVEVIWSRKAGFRRHLVGLRFVDLDQATVRKIAGIALSHGLRDAI